MSPSDANKRKGLETNSQENLAEPPAAGFDVTQNHYRRLILASGGCIAAWANHEIAAKKSGLELKFTTTSNNPNALHFVICIYFLAILHGCISGYHDCLKTGPPTFSYKYTRMVNSRTCAHPRT
jgi:hypothetical protein